MARKHAKHAKSRGNSKILSMAILVIILIVVIVVAVYLVLKLESEKQQNRQPTQNEVVNEPIVEEEDENTLSTLEIVEVDMPKKIKSYNVIGQIEIPKIKVKRYILDKTTDESIDLSIAKFWGPDMHEAGNLSLIGHNYDNLFKRLKELKNGDTFTLTSREGAICKYEIYDIFIVEPEDVECIEDSLIGQREVTLITCTTSGAQRLILKAKEYKKEKGNEENEKNN